MRSIYWVSAQRDARRLSAKQKAYLRTLVAGGEWTQARLHRIGRVDSPLCPHCPGTDAVECQEHMWWRCPAWEHIRARHTSAVQARRADWPACLLQAGVMPERLASLEAEVQITSECNEGLQSESEVFKEE